MSTVAGERLRLHYERIQKEWTVLPPTCEIMEDSLSGSDGNAQINGLNADGLPRFQVREDFPPEGLSPTEQARWVEVVSAHEITHALDLILARRGPDPMWHRRLYWEWGGFLPVFGTWQDVEAEAAGQAALSSFWMWSPAESFADAGRKALTGAGERTVICVEKPQDEMRAWFRTLAAAPSIEEPEVEPPKEDDMAKWISSDLSVATDELGNGRVMVGITGLTAGVPALGISQRIGLVGTEPTFPNHTFSVAEDATYGVLNFRGDSVKKGTSWWRVGAIQ